MNNRELVFCAGSGSCSTARLVEKGTTFFCKTHRVDEQVQSHRDHTLPIRAGDRVLAKDRRNYGVVIGMDESIATVRFDTQPRGTVDVQLSVSWLERA